MQLPYLSKFGFQQLLLHLLGSRKESCYLLVLETGKLRPMSCYHPDLNLIASLLFLWQNQFCFIYFLDIWSHFTKSNTSSQTKGLRMSGKESDWGKKRSLQLSQRVRERGGAAGQLLRSVEHTEQWSIAALERLGRVMRWSKIVEQTSFQEDYKVCSKGTFDRQLGTEMNVSSAHLDVKQAAHF